MSIRMRETTRHPMAPPGSTRPAWEQSGVPGHTTTFPLSPKRAVPVVENRFREFFLHDKEFNGDKQRVLLAAKEHVERFAGRGAQDPAIVIWVRNKGEVDELLDKLDELWQWVSVSVGESPT
jgi:hypothetical protein